MHLVSRSAVYLFFASLAFIHSPLTGNAGEIGTPTGDIILTVSGNIGVTNENKSTVFDLEMLRQMDPISFETTTIWTEGKHTFTGVSLDTLLSTVEANGSSIAATAINDYRIEIPASDAVPGGPILAYEMDGKLLSRRNKGPLWIIYPFDSKKEYRAEVIYARSIWQLVKVEVLE